MHINRLCWPGVGLYGGKCYQRHRQAGEHYTNLGVGFGTESSGLAVTGNWMHSDNDGDAAGLGLGLNIPLGHSGNGGWQRRIYQSEKR
nr:outer membrane protein, YfaZ [Raoultella sp. NCTC 9187]